MTLWELLESDFQREYGIDLEIDIISWRKFTTLLSGMSADSTFFTVFRDKKANAPLEDSHSIISSMMGRMGKKK